MADVTYAPTVTIIIYCGHCGRQKQPVGRDAPASTAGAYCDDRCPGYWEKPWPGTLWPGEKEGER